MFQTSRVEIPEIWDLVGRITPPSCVSSATRPLSRALLKYCFMFFDMGLEGIGGPGWLSRVFRGPSWGFVIKKKHTTGCQFWVLGWNFWAVLVSTRLTSLVAPSRCCSAKIQCGMCPLIAFVMGCVGFCPVSISAFLCGQRPHFQNVHVTINACIKTT